MKNMRLTRQVLLAILGAWAVVLRLLDFPLLPSAPFLKFDFSDVPVFIGLLINGPIGAAVVAFIRDFIEYLRKGGEAGIPLGVSMSFIGTMTMMLILHFYLRRKKGTWQLEQIVLTCISLAFSLTLVMSLLNYFIALPIYVEVMHWPIKNMIEMVLVAIVPFNLLKGAILGGLLSLVYNQFKAYLIKRGFILANYQ